MKNNAKKIGWLYLAMVLFVFAANIILALVVMVQMFTTADLSAASIEDSILMSPYFNILFSQAIFLIPVFFFYLFTKSKPRQYMACRKIDGLSVLLCILFSICMYPAVTLISELVSRFAFSGGQTDMIISELPFPAALLLVAVLPALSEEFICRGTIYGALRRNGILPAALISGLIFGLMHMNLLQFSYAFLMGVVFAFLIEATGSLLAPMIVHFSNNAISLILDELLSEAEFSVLWFLLLVLVSAVGILLCRMIFNCLARRSGRTKIVASIWKRRNNQPCMSVPLIIAIVLSAGMIVIVELSFYMVDLIPDFMF